MKLTVVGSGSKGNCYIMESSTGEVLLLEIGMKWKSIKESLNFNLKNIVGVLLSHAHL